MIKKRSNFLAHAIAFLGGAIVIAELLRYWLQDATINGTVIGIGAAFGFVGSYLADRKGALEGGGFVVRSVTDFVAVVRSGRSGRRATDPVVVEPVAADPVVTEEKD